MENIHKYFVIVENLAKNIFTGKESERLKSNVDIIEKYIQEDVKLLLKRPALMSINYVLEELHSEDLSWKYATLLFHILLTIKQQVNLNSDNKDELISLQQQDYYKFCVIDAARYGLCPNLVHQMQCHRIFELDMPKKTLDINKLKICLKFLQQIFEINFLMAGSKIDEIQLQSIAGAICILSSHNSDVQDNNDIIQFLTYLWDHSSKKVYFKNLLLLKAIQKLPQNVQKKLHEDLLRKLECQVGFKILVETIVPASSIEAPNWKCFEVIANIVSHKGHSEKFYDNLINQIFEFLKNAVSVEEQNRYIPAGVLSLRKLYFLNSEIKETIVGILNIIFQNLYNPEDVLTGVILLEDLEFLNFLKLFNFLFCGSSLQSLPSEILTRYLPLLIQSYDQIPDNYKQATFLKSFIIHCLANREKNELRSILKSLILENFETDYKTLHTRIAFNTNEKSNFVNLQICSPEINNRNDIFLILCRLLKISNNNILIYNSFISVLYLFEDENFEVRNMEDSISLLQSEEELNVFIQKKFKSKFAVISFLTNLIEYQPLHSQFRENPAEILDFLKSSLVKHLNIDNSQKEKLSVLLAILQEVIENSESIEIFQHFISILKKLLENEKNFALKHQIENILLLLDYNVSNESKKSNNFDKSHYEIARKLIEENQPYLKVYGIMLIIKLINEKDSDTISNKHAILAIALQALKDEESYTFLNCVKLFVTLINVLEADVLDILSDEYLNENNSTDYRLKVGEAILKVTEELGPISYKYKNILINCFLDGCRNSLNEFRLSSISNLATICRLLTYQVYNFFQELLQLIESILQTDKYLPAKRATVLVLTQLLCGMENLFDFQEYLLPIYRLLKDIAANDSDAVMRTHANNGLKILNEKCKKIFVPEQEFQKEIKIFGLKDDHKKKKSGNILELN